MNLSDTRDSLPSRESLLRALGLSPRSSASDPMTYAGILAAGVLPLLAALFALTWPERRELSPAPLPEAKPAAV